MPTTPADYHQLPANPSKCRKLVIASWILTAVVWLLVGGMQRIEISLPEGWDLSFLPMVNAGLNSCVAVCLVLAIVAVKNWKRADLHARFMAAAVWLSLLFLVCYVTYHITSGEVSFGGEGAIRSVYFFLLISHIVIAGVSFPFILLSLSYSLANEFSKHRKIVKWAYPMWLYVAVTGPIVYLMLRPYY